MMSAEYIRSESERAAREAACERRHPYVYWSEEEVVSDDFPFPFLGTYTARADGWRRLRYTALRDAGHLLDRKGFQRGPNESVALFADWSGWGEENEPALSPRQLSQAVRDILVIARRSLPKSEIGFGIIEAGQFQVVIGVFRKDG